MKRHRQWLQSSQLRLLLLRRFRDSFLMRMKLPMKRHQIKLAHYCRWCKLEVRLSMSSKTSVSLKNMKTNVKKSYNFVSRKFVLKNNPLLYFHKRRFQTSGLSRPDRSLPRPPFFQHRIPTLLQMCLRIENVGHNSHAHKWPLLPTGVCPAYIHPIEECPIQPQNIYHQQIHGWLMVGHDRPHHR